MAWLFRVFERGIINFMRLSPNQAKFAAEYIRTSNGAEAYRRAYPNAKGKNCANAAAWRMLNYPQVQREIKRIRMKIAKRAEITVEKILNDYQEAIDLARQEGKTADMISGATAQARICGLLVERREIGGAGDFDRMDSISDILEEVGKQAGPEAAMALAKAFNLVQQEAQENSAAVQEETEALLDSKPASEAVN